KYQLTELPNGGYRQRTRRNVEDSDGTLIVNLGELDGGTLATQTFAQQAGKPHLVVQLDDEVTAVAAARVRRMSELFAANVLAWLRARAIKTLNVAGPCESKRPGIYRLTGELLYVIDVMLYQS
ncbi:MAG: putative molybdenum carrier protein, partial [Zoogloeaceae bacterium]|nr:putative molybdenum carrier protein [Zoogloeaceae bacterium]